MAFCIKNYLVKFTALISSNDAYGPLGSGPLLAVALLTFSLPQTAFSEQISFNKNTLKNDIQLSYQWIDKDQERHQFSFTLPLNDIKTSHHKRFVPQQVSRYQLK